MHADQFDRWTQNLDTRVARRGLSGIFLAALIGLSPLDGEAKKKKKKKKHKDKAPVDPGQGPADPVTPTCAQQCPDGCCTSEFGDCVLPAQQGGAQCGSGGELCRVCDDDACKPLGGVCDVNAQCCDDGANPLACQDRHCCKAAFHPCETSDGCCPQLICTRSSLEPALQCRGTFGAPCSNTDGCREHSMCQTGRCCAPRNQPCELDEHCCAANEVCRVVPDYVPEKVCCMPAGEGNFCIQEGPNSACCSNQCGPNQHCI